MKVVDSLDEAIAHIAAHSIAHSDGIITRDEENETRFIKFMSETDRLNWGEADNSLRWLRRPK
ncbi:MAG: hypothetical protein HY870_06475 [Chloroflexi bacterium]|nr:hypothetical protein [Chloroflexota bacterium]